MSAVPWVLAVGLAFPECPTVLPDGSLLCSEMAAGRITRCGPAGTTETYAETGGGPNGFAVLPDGRLVVAQNGGSRWGVGPWPYDLPGAAQLFRPTGPPAAGLPAQLQAVDPDGTVSTLTVSFRATDGDVRPLVRPSDLCPDGAGGFYLTDGGTVRGRTRELTGLLHGTPDGEVRELLYPLEMPNGVALSPDGATLYVAETRTRRIWACEVRAPGELGVVRGFATVPSGGPLNVGGADGLCVDTAGNLIVATLGTGGVTVFRPDGSLLLALPMDDPMTTNVTVDGPRDRLVVALASSGRVVVVDDWSSVVGVE